MPTSNGADKGGAMAKARKREYQAVIWWGSDRAAAQRLVLLAEDGDDAIRQLRNRYGQDVKCSVWNEDEADTIR